MALRSRRAVLAALGSFAAGCVGTPESPATEQSPDTARPSPTEDPETPTIGSVSGAWRNPAGDAGNAGYAPDASGPSDAPRPAWSADVADAGTLVVADGTVFVNAPGTVSALDAATGERRWSAETVPRDDRPGGPVVAGGRVLVSDDTGLFALDAADGTELWRREEPRREHGWLRVAGGEAFAVVEDELLAVDAADGTELWRATTEQSRYGGVAVGEGAVCATVTSNGSYVPLAAYERDDGTERWRGDGVSHSGSPTVRNGRFFSGGFYGDVAAWSVETGEREWRRTPVTMANGLLADDDRVYVRNGGDTDGPMVVVLDAATGDEAWRAEEAAPRAVAGDTVYADDGERLVALDAATGEKRWAASARLASVAVVDGVLFGRRPGGGVVALAD